MANEMSYNPSKKYPFDDIGSFCENGSFYFSLDYDLTHSQQRLHCNRHEMMNKKASESADKRFFWNSYLAQKFIRRDLDSYIAILIRGNVSICNGIKSGDNTKYDFILISRISCSNAGTRYNARGINENGDVGNFVETEQIVSNEKYITSSVQIRGSVPVYWEEPLTKAGYIPTLSRSVEASSYIFKKHFDDLYDIYKKIHVINLLGHKKKEGVICYAYENQISKMKVLKNPRLSYTHFDYHAECTGQNYDKLKNLVIQVQEDMAFFEFFKYDIQMNKITQLQNGTFRTNCLDCLDRTNVTQSFLAKQIILHQLRSILDGSTQTHTLLSLFNTFWADNGDSLSQAYTGTGALNSSYTRNGKSSIAGLVNDSFKSLTRFYINTFKDADNQKCIDIFVGKVNFNIDNDEDIWVKNELARLEHEYTNYVNKHVFIGSFNCLGRSPRSIENVEKWISINSNYEDIGLWVFGFQEVVELNPSQIINANDANARLWDEFILEYLNSKGSRIVQLKSYQLVGLYISVFAAESELPYIKNVNFCSSKVGLKGMSGDKGAITISLVYHDSLICFVNSHLASGQNNNNDRISDFKTINNNIRVGVSKSSKKLDDHDFVFWFGDMNWRIDLPYEKTLELISFGDIEELLCYDQLKKAQRNKLAFQNFKEAPITFFPTYKFVVGKKIYESIEVNRPPGWTDRILYMSTQEQPIDYVHYNSADLYLSDHLPIRGQYQFVVKNVNKELKQRREDELYKRNQMLNSLL